MSRCLYIFSITVLLLVALTSARITNLVLIDADSDKDLFPLKNSQTVDISTLPPKLTLRADATDIGQTKEVRFFVNNKRVRTERYAPYAIAGDRGGDYIPWNDFPTSGDVTFRVDQILRSGRYEVLLIKIRVEGGATSGDGIKVTIVDAGTDKDFKMLEDGDSFKRSELPYLVSLRADIVPKSGGRNMVKFFVNGNLVRTESYAPYAIAGDRGKSGGGTDYLPYNLPGGKVTLRVEQSVGGKVTEKIILTFTIGPGGGGETVTPTPTSTASPTPTSSPVPTVTPPAKCSCDSGKRVRKEFGTLTDAEWNRFVKAFKALKDTDDGMSTFEKFVDTHRINAGEAHSTVQFLPWHREYLFQVECKLQQIDPDVTIPYWDWSIDSADPPLSPLWKRVGGAKKEEPIPNSPFKGWSSSVDVPHLVVRGFNAGEPGAFVYGVENAETIRNMQKDGDLLFSDFTAALELFHGLPHIGVGGDTGDMSSIIRSPNDPTFFMHHAFVDKIWYEWQKNPGKKREYDGFHLDDEVSLKDTTSPWEGTIEDFFARDACVSYKEPTRSGVPESVRIARKARLRAGAIMRQAEESSTSNSTTTADPSPSTDVPAPLAQKAKDIPVVQEALVEADAKEKEVLAEAAEKSDERVEAVAERVRKNQGFAKWAAIAGVSKKTVEVAKKVAAKEDPTVEFSELEDGKPPGE